MSRGKKLIALDTYYFSETEAKTVGVIFSDWRASKPDEIIESWCSEFGPYIPGEFYKRELPCILNLLCSNFNNMYDFDAIILDSLARLPGEHDGLGIRLESALEEKGMLLHDVSNMTGIIGVAKTKFLGAQGDSGTAKVFRGESKLPLYVNTSWIGYSSNSAAACIKSMHGEYRIPTLLKLADTESRRR